MELSIILEELQRDIYSKVSHLSGDEQAYFYEELSYWAKQESELAKDMSNFNFIDEDEV